MHVSPSRILVEFFLNFQQDSTIFGKLPIFNKTKSISLLQQNHSTMAKHCGTGAHCRELLLKHLRSKRLLQSKYPAKKPSPKTVLEWAACSPEKGSKEIVCKRSTFRCLSTGSVSK
jgi:hypothetical protein